MVLSGVVNTLNNGSIVEIQILNVQMIMKPEYLKLFWILIDKMYLNQILSENLDWNPTFLAIVFYEFGLIQIQGQCLIVAHIL